MSPSYVLSPVLRAPIHHDQLVRDLEGLQGRFSIGRRWSRFPDSFRAGMTTLKEQADRDDSRPGAGTKDGIPSSIGNRVWQLMQRSSRSPVASSEPRHLAQTKPAMCPTGSPKGYQTG